MILWDAHTCIVKWFEEVEIRWAEIECTLHRSPISSEISGRSRPFQYLFVDKPTTYGLDTDASRITEEITNFRKIDKEMKQMKQRHQHNQSR